MNNDLTKQASDCCPAQKCRNIDDPVKGIDPKKPSKCVDGIEDLIKDPYFWTDEEKKKFYETEHKAPDKSLGIRLTPISTREAKREFYKNSVAW